MSFNLCPLDARAEKIFRFPNRQLMRPRVPLGERAGAVARERTISMAEAKSVRYWPEAVLAGNLVQQFRGKTFLDYQLANLALYHLAPAFEDKAVCFWFENIEGVTHVIVKAAEKGTVFSSAPFDRSQNDRLHFEVTLTLRPHTSSLLMYDLLSTCSGQAGRALPAIYNLARDLKLAQIEFTVSERNSSARRFYFHLDFGAPLNFSCTEWTVETGLT